MRRTRTTRHLRDRDPRGHGRDPARLPDADLRLRGHLPRADDPRRARAARSSSASRTTLAVRVQRAPARRLRAGRARRPPDGRDRRRQLVRLPLPQRSGRRDALVPRPRARPHVAARSTTGCSRCTCSRTTSSASSTCRPGEYDVPIVIADHAFNKDGSFRYDENVDLGFRGDTILVNGAVSPRMRVAAAQVPPALPERVQRPLVHAAARQRPPDDCRSPATAGCSRTPGLARAVSRSTRPSGSTSSSTSRAYGPGDRARPAQRRTASAARCRSCASTSSAAAAARTSASRRGCASPSRCRPANARRRWDLALGTAAWQINGLGFDPNRIDVRPRRGSTEIWTFVNHSNRVHPMHLHGFQFRVLERIERAASQPADRLGWKDTVGVLPNETVTVLAWFAPYGGKYVFHCHSLEHADKAMMLQMEVRSMKRRSSPLTVARAASCFPAAASADATIQAIDGACRRQTTTAGRRNAVTVKVGETVTWTFAGTSSRTTSSPTARTGPSATRRPVSGPRRPRTRSPTPGDLRVLLPGARGNDARHGHVTDATGTPPPPPPPPPLERAAVPQRRAGADDARGRRRDAAAADPRARRAHRPRGARALPPLRARTRHGARAPG